MLCGKLYRLPFCVTAARYAHRILPSVQKSEGAAMSYPAKTTASLMADHIFVAAVVGFAGFVLAVFFIVFALGDFRLSLTDPKFAEIMQKTTQQHVRIMKDGNLRRWEVNWVDLRLVEDSAQAIRFGLSPSDETFAKLATGQRVLVRFNRSNPLSSVLESEFRPWELRPAAKSFGHLAILSFISSFFLLALGKAKARRWIRTRDHGLERSACVVAHETSIWRGGKGTIGISATWHDEAGHMGRTFWTQIGPGAPVKHLPPVGARICVYVDEVAPHHSVWEGDVGTRAASDGAH